MNHLIYELFNNVKAEDEKVSNNAIVALRCILEMNTWHLSKEDRRSRFGSLFSQEIIELEIDENEEAKIVEFLHDEIINNHKFTSSMLFAIGQASCQVGLKPLIDILEQHLNRFNENEIYQALISIERLLFFDESLSIEEEREIIAKTNLLSAISAKILSLEPISHSDLESTCLRLLARLILLLDGTYSE